MNKFLADVLSVLNGLIAIILILFGISISIGIKDDIPRFGLEPESYMFVYVFGGIVGVLLAVIFCGLIAVLLDTRNVLRTILAEIQRANRISRQPGGEIERKEPNFAKSNDR